jgi:hypothetical protein
MSSDKLVSSDPVIHIAELWCSLFELAATEREAILNCCEMFCDPITQRKHWLEAFTGPMGGYMMLTAYHALMQSSFKAIAGVKAFQDELLRGFADKFSVPVTGNDQELSDRLRLAEVALASRLEAIEDRLARIETRLDVSLSPG